MRLRNFTLGTKLSDKEVVGGQGLERIAEVISCMVPFVSGTNFFSCLYSVWWARVSCGSDTFGGDGGKTTSGLKNLIEGRGRIVAETGRLAAGEVVRWHCKAPKGAAGTVRGGGRAHTC